MLDIEITDRAQSDITNIADYISYQSYEKYAQDFGRKLYKLFELLRHSPTIGTERTQSGEGIRLYPMDKINIIYRIKEDTLQILRVHHSALDSNTLQF